jgi:hypothetical protein
MAASLVAVDMNRDGNLDLVGQSTGRVGIALGNGDGSFQPMRTFVTAGGFPIRVAAGDVNGDGAPDVVTVDVEGNMLSLFLGDGAGGLGTPTPFAVAGDFAVGISVGDLSGDGRADVAAAGQRDDGSGVISVLLAP